MTIPEGTVTEIPYNFESIVWFNMNYDVQTQTFYSLIGIVNATGKLTQFLATVDFSTAQVRILLSIIAYLIIVYSSWTSLR
jgi:hypothetical protein